MQAFPLNEYLSMQVRHAVSSLAYEQVLHNLKQVSQIFSEFTKEPSGHFE